MISCLSIRLKNKPNYEFCQSYRVLANEDGTGAGVRSTLCGGNTTQDAWVPAGEERIICAEFGTPPVQISGSSSIEVTLIGVCTDENSAAQDEAVYFDLPDNFSLRETKRLTELTAVQALKFTYSIGFDLPPTKHNLSLIKTQFNPNVLDNEYPTLEVEVIAGSHIVSDAQLYISRCTEERITADLRLSVNHWARKAKSLKLRDLPYRDVTWGCDLITDVITNQYPYQLSTDFDDPDNLGIWFPWIDYGRMVRDTGNGRNNDWMLPVCYNRPLYYVTGLLQRGFCALGWGFTSPIFESEVGRKILTYIMDRSYGLSGQVYEQRRNNLNARAESQGDTAILFQYGNRAGSIWWPQITEDPGGHIDTTEGWYSACGEVNIRGKVVLAESGNSTKMTVSIVRMKPQAGYPAGTGGSVVYSVIESREFTNLDEDNEWEFELENISMSSEEHLGVFVQRNGTGLVLLRDGSFIEFEGVRPYPSEGDLESLQNMIDGQYTFLDLLKGLAHDLNLKFKTDFGNRTVEIYQPYTNNFWGETIEGFFIEQTIEDIDAMFDPTTKVADAPDTEQPRFVRLSYADTSDTHIESLELAEPLWSRLVDLGEKFTVKETQDIKNPFFEPTASRNARFANSFGVHIPKIGGETEYTFDVDPRIMIAHGYVIQELDNVNNPQLRLCTFDAVQSSLIPTASMFSPVKLGTVHNDDGASAEYPAANLVFDVNPEVSTVRPETSLYDLVYRRWLIEQLNNIKLEYLLDLSPYDYHRIDFRGLVQFTHMGRPVLARIQEVKDYRYCEKIFTPVVFIPQRQLSDICDIIPITDGVGDGPVCENNPVLICSSPGPGHYVFVIGGQNNSPILSTAFQYSTNGGASWTGIPPLSPISAELNPITVDFLVRAAVIYDNDCPTIFLPEKSVIPCPVFNYELVCEETTVYVPDQQNIPLRAVRVIADLPPGQTVTVVSSEYNIDGGANEPYAVVIQNNQLIGSGVYGGTEANFFITIQVGVCPPINLMQTCTLDQVSGITPLDCTNSVLQLECVQDFPGCWTFSRNGIIFGEYDDYIKYRCSDDGINYGPWMLWDEENPVCCDYIQARWWAIFCDNECPPKCSNIIQCEVSCEPFEVGPAPTIALCNNS